MSRSLVVCVVALVFAGACMEKPDGQAGPKSDSPFAPSVSEVTPDEQEGSTVCQAYRRELAGVVGAFERQPLDAELQASVNALEAITADVCN